MCIHELSQKGKMNDSQEVPYKRPAAHPLFQFLFLLMQRRESFPGPLNVGLLHPSVFFSATIFQSGLSLLTWTSRWPHISILRMQGQPDVPSTLRLLWLSAAWDVETPPRKGKALA